MVRVATAEGMSACAVNSDVPAAIASGSVNQSSLRDVLVSAQSAPVVVLGSTLGTATPGYGCDCLIRKETPTAGVSGNFASFAVAKSREGRV